MDRFDRLENRDTFHDWLDEVNLQSKIISRLAGAITKGRDDMEYRVKNKTKRLKGYLAITEDRTVTYHRFPPTEIIGLKTIIPIDVEYTEGQLS